MTRLLTFALLLVSITAAAEPRSKVVVRKLPALSFGLTGYASAEYARADAEALQTFLTQRLGRDVSTRIFPTRAALAAAIASGEVDLALLQPFTLLDAQSKGAVKPLVKAVRHNLPFYRGVLFTLADRKVDGLRGLKGMTVAWVDRESASGFLFPRAAIVQAGITPSDLFKSESFRGDHEAVCRAVLDGSVDVGATFADDRPGGTPVIDGCVLALGEEQAHRLKIVATSAPIPNDAIVAKPGLDPDEVERIRKVFLGLKKDHAGQLVLLGVFKAQSFEPIGEDDFVPVKFAADAVSR